MRSRVNDTIEKLGFVPDGNARALASRRRGAIGALIPTLDNPIFGATSDSLEQRIKCHDCRLLIATYHHDLDDGFQALRHLIQQGIDGIVLFGHDHRPAPCSSNVGFPSCLAGMQKTILPGPAPS